MTTSTDSLTRRGRPRAPLPSTSAVFHAPPLRPIVIDIARDLAAIRQRRTQLTQRVGAVWIRGHTR